MYGDDPLYVRARSPTIGEHVYIYKRAKTSQCQPDTIYTSVRPQEGQMSTFASSEIVKNLWTMLSAGVEQSGKCYGQDSSTAVAQLSNCP